MSVRAVPRGTIAGFNLKSEEFDILVIGGGHAGVEAAWISSEFPISVCLLSIPGVGLASAPCNPSIGGVGKGQVVRELDVLGGLMGRLADLAGIQYRTLNESKGFAVQSTRVQVDKDKYSQNAEKLISERKNLKVVRAKANLIQKSQYGFEVHTEEGEILKSKKIIITTGTFLNGKLHTGSEQNQGGRVDCERSVGLSDLFSEVKTLGLRFKTGTPPRIDRKSIDFSVMEPQESDSSTRNFHFLHDSVKRHIRQVPCYLTRTNEETLGIIRDNKERSPMFNGQIQGVGPRYCPSIEDKAFRYLDRNTHHVFIEPEGLDLETIYPSGISTSLPKDVQESFVRTIKGLENAKILVHGYAVEYDVVDTSRLRRTLEYSDIPGLYFAGQVNGTSGYEEAAGQGIIAGANAALAVLGKESLILEREESYIGVMIDDLVSSQRDEPYRLFTARSEFRLYLREDNTLNRISKYRKALGLKNSTDLALDMYLSEYSILDSLCESTVYRSSTEEKARFEQLNYGPLDNNLILSELLKRPEVNPVTTLAFESQNMGVQFRSDVIYAVAVEKKYSGYMARAKEESEKMAKQNQKRIQWQKLVDSKNISHECKVRIERIRPETFGQLRKIEGIRPATLAYVSGNAL